MAAKGKIFQYGAIKGPNNTEFIQFNDTSELNRFYGFATQVEDGSDSSTAAIGSMAIIKYDKSCFNNYLVSKAEAAESEQLEPIEAEDFKAV